MEVREHLFSSYQTRHSQKTHLFFTGVKKETHEKVVLGSMVYVALEVQIYSIKRRESAH